MEASWITPMLPLANWIRTRTEKEEAEIQKASWFQLIRIAHVWKQQQCETGNKE